MEFLQLGGNIPSRSGPCHFPCDTVTFIGLHISFPAQGISPGLASWGRLVHAELEVEHCGIPSEQRDVSILQFRLLAVCPSPCHVSILVVIGIWECGYIALPCPLLSVFSLMPGSFMASAAFTSVWLWKSTWYYVNTSQFSTLPFPNTHEMCRSCCNRICGCWSDSTLSNRTHFPFHRRNWVCLLSISYWPSSGVSLCGEDSLTALCFAFSLRYFYPCIF